MADPAMMARFLAYTGDDDAMAGHSTSNPSPPSALAAGVLGDLRSPTPYHAVARASSLLAEVGFEEVDLGQSLPASPGPRFAVQGGSLVAWVQGAATNGYLVVGAHTDSPNLRVRTNPDLSSGGFSQVGMEIYGGVLLNSWLDRDLSLAGRVSVQSGTSAHPEERLYLDDRPLLRIPQLAIHLDREIRERGLKLDAQKHLTPLWAVGEGSEGDLRAHVAEGLGVEPGAILAWDLMAYDTQPPAIVGRDRDLFSAARIDNLVSA
ncbi:MAG: hypothetical protein GY724_27660, partial [Actinomycetia bacterium]|nr:hypothetical protein [Actinomycetes bacterium]